MSLHLIAFLILYKKNVYKIHFKIHMLGHKYFILMQQYIISVILFYGKMRLILRLCSLLLTLIYLTAQ